MDKYFISSELAFYDGVFLTDGSPRVSGRGIFPNMFAGDLGLMWNDWVPPKTLSGRPVVLISFARDHLERPQIADHFDHLSPIRRQGVSKGTRLITEFYWRAGYGYRDQ